MNWKNPHSFMHYWTWWYQVNGSQWGEDACRYQRSGEIYCLNLALKMEAACSPQTMVAT